MFKSILIAISSTVLSSTALASEPESVRLVLSHAPSVEQQTQQFNRDGAICVNENGHSWCLPKPAQTNAILSRSAGLAQKSARKVITLESFGLTADEVAKILNQQQSTWLVEPDIVIHSTSTMPNDPELNSQSYYQSLEHLPGGLNVFGMWESHDTLSGNSASGIDLIIADSSFFESPEIEYTGRSFVTTPVDGVPQRPNDNYSPRPESVDQGLCNGHGLGVATIAAGVEDNDIMGAGVVQNATVHAMRVMDCGTGVLSDLATMLDWLAGETVEGVSPYEGNPGIVNMSLGGQGSDTCPTYMQSAINKAKDAGFILVAAAGNSTMTDPNFYPADCDGVIAVGAIDEDSGLLTEFTNRGQFIDYVAPGMFILGACNENDPNPCWWEGTSASTPLISGVIAAVVQELGVGSDIVELALSLSSSAATLETDCKGATCGNGLPDAALFSKYAFEFQNGMIGKVDYLINNLDECQQDWAVKYFGDRAPLCSIVQLTFLQNKQLDAGEYIQLLSRAPESSGWENETVTLVDEYPDSQVTVTEIDTALNYGFKICDADGSCSKTITMDTSGITETPRACTD